MAAVDSVETRLPDPPDGIVRVVQLTDTHLGAERGDTLLSLDTDFSLQQVIALVQRERTHVDLVLATGDLADGGSTTAYERLEAYLTPLCPHHFWLVGNHDDRGAMARVASENRRMVGCVRAGNWQVLMLDSQIPGKVGGRLGTTQLARLKQQLEAAEQDGLYSLVCLHHHPLPVRSAWLDEQLVEDGAQFLDLVASFAGARAIVWGHIHQEIDSRHDHLALLATPSTCVQFGPGSSSFKADDQPPGYRWLDLLPDGSFETGVSRVSGVNFPVDLQSDGYQ